MKVLVTGGSGFLGINLIRFLRTQGVDEIRVLDIADFDYPERDAPWLRFTKGDVRDVAEVAVNGRRYPVLWKAPFRVDVTGAVKPGENALEVRVTNRWPNRLIGDERLYGADTEWNADNKWGIPLAKAVPDWVARGEASPTGRRAFAMSKLWRADDALLPSGLLGPVQCIVRENTK